MKPNLYAIPTPLASYYTPETRRKIHKLAGALCAALNIQPGDQLVMLLGYGGERTNLEAVQTWVTETLVELEMLPTRQAIPALLEKLENELIAWQSESW